MPVDLETDSIPVLGPDAVVFDVRVVLELVVNVWPV